MIETARPCFNFHFTYLTRAKTGLSAAVLLHVHTYGFYCILVLRCRMATHNENNVVHASGNQVSQYLHLPAARTHLIRSIDLTETCRGGVMNSMLNF